MLPVSDSQLLLLLRFVAVVAAAATAAVAATPEVVKTRVDTALKNANVETAATAIAKAGSRGRGSANAAAAATVIVETFGRGETKSDSVAEAFAASAAKDATASAVVFAKAAKESRKRGYEQQFGRQCVSHNVLFSNRLGPLGCGLANNNLLANLLTYFLTWFGTRIVKFLNRSAPPVLPLLLETPASPWLSTLARQH